MLGKTFKDEAGKVHTFEEILEIFDAITKQYTGYTQFAYTPILKKITIVYRDHSPSLSLTSYTFTEI